MSKQIKLYAWGMAALLATASAGAATCTSKANGNWNSATTWNCTAGTTPAAGDSVVINHTVTLNNSYSITNVTVNAGGILVDNNNNQTLTISGNLAVDGAINNGGGRVELNVTGNTSVISGTGTLTSVRFYVSGTAPQIVAGSNLNFAGSSRLYVGRTQGGATVAGAVLTINGTLNSTVPTATTTFLRLYATNTVISSTGAINASVSAVTYNTTTVTVTNNGSVNVNQITQNAATNSWTQGASSSLTVSAVSSLGSLSASATGNTVTYNGTSVPITPVSSYYNLAGTAVTCPHGFTVTGSDPCPVGGPLSVTKSPGSCINLAGVGTLAWATPANAVSSNNTNTTVTAPAAVGAYLSNYLKCTNFGFAIPAGATINGIVVKLERRLSSVTSTSGKDNDVKLVDAVGTIVGSNHTTATAYTTTDVIESHGTSADTWGTTLTATDINDIDFGAVYSGSLTKTSTSTSRQIRVDHMSITVTYTAAATTPDHVSISAPATAMALAETPVTIAPHTSAHAAMTAAGTINLSTSTGTGDWTIGTGTGTLTPGAANSGLATYTFGAAESSATLGFTAQTAGAVTLNVAYGATDMLLNTPVGEKANTITFSAASFVFTSSACTHNVAFGTVGQCALATWSPRVAGQALGSIYITSVNASGVPTRLHPVQIRTRDMQFGLSCHDPVANAGVSATFSATATALPLCQGSGATPTTWTTAVTLSFTGGSPSVGPYSFNYDDVGKVEMWLRNSAATSELGASGVFVVKPAGFTLSNIKRSSDSVVNPAAADASGTAFVKAGEAFMATVTAVNASGVATPNYGKEATPESVKLTPALVAGLGLTNNPAIGGAFGTFGAAHPSGIPAGVGGVAHGTAFIWDEVGIITLTPSVGDADYLGAGDATGSTSGNVGRFTLGKFTLQGVSFDERADLCQGGLLVSDGVTACAPTFSYMGERVDANFTLLPNSLNDTNVLNYVDSATAANDFAKLTPTTFADLNLGAVDTLSSGAPHYLTARISNSGLTAASCATTPCFQSGSATVNVPFMLTRGASADGVFGTTDIGIALADSDGARVEGPGATAGLCNNPNAVDCYDLNSDASASNDRALLGTTEFRYGRTHLDNAVGSELLTLNMPIKLEYWNGSRYVTSTDDTLSRLTLNMDNYLGNLASGETTLTASAFASGIGQIGLSAPGIGNNGSVDVSVTVPTYLPSDTARGTFGVYKGNKAFIYLRESY